MPIRINRVHPPTYSPPPVKMNSFQLPFRFDRARLQADLDEIHPDEWIEHFSKGDYEGAWGIVLLRAVLGSPTIIYDDWLREIFPAGERQG